MRLTSLKLRGKKNKKEITTTQNSSQHQQFLQYNQQQQAFQQQYSVKGSEVRNSSQNSQQMNYQGQGAPMMQKDGMDGVLASKDDPFWMRRRYTRDDSFPELTQVLDFMTPFEQENVSNYAQPPPQRLPVPKKLDEFTPVSQQSQPIFYQSPNRAPPGPPALNSSFNQSGSLYNQQSSKYNPVQAPRMSQKPYMGQGGVALPGMASSGNNGAQGYQNQDTKHSHKRIKKKVHRKRSPEQQVPKPSPQYQPPIAQNNQQQFQVPQFRLPPPGPGQMMQAPPPPNKSFAPGYQNQGNMGYQNQGNIGYQNQGNMGYQSPQHQSPPKYGMGPPPMPPPAQQNDLSNILMSKTYARQRAQSLSANQNPLAQTVPYNPQGNSFTPNNGAPPPPPPKVMRQNPSNGQYQYNNY